jgi:hypothetical protein
MRRVYTEEQQEFFAEYVPGHTAKEIVEEYNRRFNSDITLEKVRAYKKNHGLISGTPKGTPKGPSRTFPKEVYDFIFENNRGKTAVEITNLVNEKFRTNYKLAQIKTFRKNHSLISGLTGQFLKGNIPQNKGLKGWYNPGCEKGWFKKGHHALNKAELGTEVVNKFGYHRVKIGEPNVWKFKHLLVWEEHNGKVPKGCLIIFADGNKDNCDISNLRCITQTENVIMNRYDLRAESAELTEIGLSIAKLKHKTSELSKEMKSAENSNS